MAGLKNIKLKIQSVKKTRQVTRAMEAVSAVKMRKAQEQALGSRAYARAAMRILANVAGTKSLNDHPLMHTGAPERTAIVLVTSDKGLAGSLNSAVLKKADLILKDTQVKPVFLCLGRRGLEYAQRRGEVVYQNINLSDTVEENQLNALTEKALGLFMSGEVSRVAMLYTNFRSTFEQEATMRELLPLSPVALAELVAGITPEKGLYAPEGPEGQPVASYTVEPSAEEVLNEILPRLVNITVFHALLESKASEHSARMVAMKNATDKAGDVVKSLNLAYNKARQAAITAEVSEITSGIEAMK